MSLNEEQIKTFQKKKYHGSAPIWRKVLEETYWVCPVMEKSN